MALLLYDGNCGFCVKLMKRFGWLLHRSVSAMPLQDFQSMDSRFQQAELLRAITLIDNNHVFRGAEAIARSIVGARYVYYIPGIRQLADAGYHLVARNRAVLPGGCRSTVLRNN